MLAYSTRQKINPKYWNGSKQRAKETGAFPHYSELNSLLSKLENETFNSYRKQLIDVNNSSNDILKQELNKLLKIDPSGFNPPEKKESYELLVAIT